MKFTVIVPVCDHWHFIEDLLNCLERQTVSKNEFEILLIENGSKNFFLPKTGLKNIRILTCWKLGSYASRNFGVTAAKGEWLVFTDADCLPEHDWLERITCEVDRCYDEFHLFAGGITVVSESSSPNYYEIYDVLKGIPQFRYVKQGYAATANLTVHRKLFDRLGGFGEQLFSGGDADFCRRAVGRGAQLMYLPHAVVKHRARTTWQEVATKARRIKGGKIRVRSRKKRTVAVIRSLLPPVIAIYRFAISGGYPWYYRGVAISVQLRLWFVELKELARLACNGEAERR